jgi:DNA-binding Lrp family transcriptional regulator
MPVDRIDFEIIDALQNDARLSNKQLAARIGLAPSSCLTRVRALASKGILLGHHAEILPAAMGIGLQALVAVRLTRTSRDAFRALQAHAMSLPEVLAVFHVSGGYDLQIHVAVRDVAHLRDLIVDKLATRKEVNRTETSVIYTHERKPALPRYVISPTERSGRRRATSRRAHARQT